MRSSLVVGLFATLLSLTNAQSNIPVINSISGCGSNNQVTAIVTGQATGCSTHQSITIQGSNLDARQALVMINNTQCMYPWNPARAVNAVTDPPTGQSVGAYSQLICTLNNYNYDGLAYDQLLPVTVYNLLDNTVSAPYNGVSFSYVPAPRVDSIIGCGTANNTASLCNLTSSMITVIGDSFTQDANAYSYSFYFTTASAYVNQVWPSQPTANTANNPCFNIINSTMMTFCLNSTIWYTPFPTTGKMTFFLVHGSMVSSNNFTVWFDQSTAPRLANPAPVRFGNAMGITGVSGCVDQKTPMMFGNRTYNATTTTGCVKPAEFTITGYGFIRSGLLITVGNERCWQLNQNNNRSQITCQVMESAANMVYDQPLPVVVYDMFNNIQTSPFYAVTYISQQIPFIDGISGCDDQSLDQTNNQPTTLNCDSSASITLSGSNFVSQGQTWSILTAIPNNYQVAQLTLPTGSMLDDSTIVIPLSVFQPYMSNILSSTNNATISLCLKVGANMGLVSNCARLQFAMPVMSVTTLNGCTPVYQNGTSTALSLTNCYAGTSILSITGTNLFEPLIVTVGGVTCTNQITYTTGVQCLLPTIPDFEPGFAYDLSIYQSNLGTTYNLPGAIRFAQRPTITSITSQFCPADARSTTMPSLRCDSGDVLTIFGSFFNQSNALSVSFSVYSWQGVCVNTTVVYEDQITCVLPSPDIRIRGLIANQVIAVTVTDNTTQITSNSVSAVLYRALTDPSIKQVIGCTGFSDVDQAATGCQTGHVITINGLNFGALLGQPVRASPMLSLFDVETLGYYAAMNVTVVNATQIVAILPYIHRSSSVDVMAIQLTLPSRNYAHSNWFYGVEYSSELPSTNTTDTIYVTEYIVARASDYETSYIIALSVLIPITFILLVLFVLATYSLHRLRSERSPAVLNQSSVIESDVNMGKYSSHRDVEMSYSSPNY